MRATRRFRRGVVLGPLAVLAVVAFFALDLGQYLSLEYLQMRREQLQAVAQARPWISAGMFLLGFALCITLSLPVSAVVGLAAGAMYGLFWGAVLATLTSAVGAAGAFLVARHWLRERLEARYQDRLSVLNAEIERDGAFYLFSLRLTPLIPFALTNLLMGLTPMRLATFTGISLIGMLPLKAIFANAGTRLAQLESAADVLSPGLLAALALLGVLPLITRKLVVWASRRRES